MVIQKIVKDKILLIVIVCFAFFLRVYNLGLIPGSLNPDEVALGYTSYAILKTGADEHGSFFPLSIMSFGDWKLPVYSYVGIIPISVFGLTEFAVRLPSAIAGVIGVILIFYISLLLFQKKTISLFVALFFALSPWNIYFSRAAYEVNLATMFFLAGLLAFIMYFFNAQRKSRWFFIGVILQIITMFTYHSFIIFTPVFCIFFLIMLRKKIHWEKMIFVSVMLFVFFTSVSYVSLILNAGNKVSTLAIFNDRDIIYNRVEKLRGDNAAKNQLAERFLHTKYVGVPYQIVQNYINSFSPSFLFDKGGEKLVHNLGVFGNLYLFDALFLVVGLAFLFWNREKALFLLIPWLVLAPIPSIITRDTPNTTRLFQLMPLFTIVAGYGAYQMSVIFKKKTIINFGIKAILVSIFFLNVVYFLDIYFVHMNVQRMRFWHYGYRQAVSLSQKNPDHNLVMRGPENFPYIYFLFYNSYDPQIFRKEVKYYPPTDEGFLYVKSFGRYTFVNKIDYSKLDPKTIYIDDTRLDDRENSIFLPSGESILGYFITK